MPKQMNPDGVSGVLNLKKHLRSIAPKFARPANQTDPNDAKETLNLPDTDDQASKGTSLQDEIGSGQ